jgi:hypothetical protein
MAPPVAHRLADTIAQELALRVQRPVTTDDAVAADD